MLYLITNNILIIVAFLMGIKIGMKVKKGEDIKISNPIKEIPKKRKEQHRKENSRWI